jgi:hypothetical protein
MATGRRNQTRDSDSAKIVRLFDLAARVRADGAAAAFDLLCVRAGLTAEDLARRTGRTIKSVSRDLAWMDRLLATDAEVRRAFEAVAASEPRRPSRPDATPRPRVSGRRPLFGSHPARTDGQGRLAVPAAFRACHRDGGWLACVDPKSATLIPRTASSTVVTGVPIRPFAGSRARHAVVLGPSWADSEVVVVGNVEDLRVFRTEPLEDELSRRKGPGIPALPDPRPSGSISTGFYGLDEAVGGGLWRGELATVGGPPGVGLSTLLLQVAISVARRGARVAWIGSHLLPGAVRLRVESLVARVSSLALARSFIDIELPPLEAGRVRKARTLLARAPISVTCGARTLDDLEAALAVAAESGALLAVVDNVVFPPGGTRRGFARLRAIAREREIAVLVATRTTRTDLPSSAKVTDVRGFAAASQEGSSVVLLHRPGVISLRAGCDEDETVLLGTHGEGRLRFRRDHGPRFEDVPIGRRR